MLLRSISLRVNELLVLQVRDFVLGGPAFVVYVIRFKKGAATEYDPIYINPDLGVQLRDYIRVHDFKQMEQFFGGGENKRGFSPEDNRPRSPVCIWIRRPNFHRPKGQAQGLSQFLYPDYD